MGDSDIDADGNGGGTCRGQEINGDVEWAEAGMVGEALRGLALYILFSSDEVSKGSKELEDGEQGVSDVVMEGGLVLLGEATREQVVAMAVTFFFAEGTRGGVGVSNSGSRSLRRRRSRYLSGVKRWSWKRRGRECRGMPVVGERREGKMLVVGSDASREERKVRKVSAVKWW
jgi:hypothetical protein